MSLSEVQQAAIELYDAGFNVFPQPYMESKYFQFKHLRATRIHKSQIPTVFAGQCNIAVLTGRTSKNLCVIECLTDDAFKKQQQIISQNLFSFWEVKTASGGQIWFRVQQECIENMAEGELDADVIVHGHGRYVLVPPSKLPNNQTFEWQKQTLKLPYTELSTIYKLDLNITPYYKQQGKPKYVQELEALAHANNWTPEMLEMAKQEKRDEYRVRRMKAKRHLQGAAAYLAKYWNWRDRQGTKDFAMVKALIDIVQRIKPPRRRFFVSYRKLAGEARVDTGTVERFMQGLLATHPPVLERLSFNPDTRAGYYCFGEKIVAIGESLIAQGDTNPTYSFFLDMFTTSLTSKDVLEPKSVGYHRLFVYYLLNHPNTRLLPSEIFAQTGFSVEQVDRICKKLEGLGLLAQDAQFYYSVVPGADDWEQIAKATGVEGKGAERKQKHREERQKYAGMKIIEHRYKHDTHYPHGTP